MRGFICVLAHLRAVPCRDKCVVPTPMAGGGGSTRRDQPTAGSGPQPAAWVDEPEGGEWEVHVPNSLAKLQRVHASAVPKNCVPSWYRSCGNHEPSRHGGLGGGSPKKTTPLCQVVGKPRASNPNWKEVGQAAIS